MNNQQFRRLVLDTPGRSSDGAGSSNGPTPKVPSTPGFALGSRARSSIPMTPRSVRAGASSEFARQLAERRAAEQPAKKFRSSAAPKGTKLAPGYQDRARQRRDEEDEDDKATRIKNLEEAVKLGQMDQATFERVRDTILGGDINSTHLVKGLDLKLLERIERGEDVYNTEPSAAPSQPSPPPLDADEELEKLEEKDVAPVVREKVEKKGTMAPPPVAGVKRNRNDILAEFKAKRKAEEEAKKAAQPVLGPKFRRIGAPSQRLEADHLGREVLVITDEHGNEKRKVRKVQTKDGPLPMPDPKAKPLGWDAVVPKQPTTQPATQQPEAEEDEDEDIFAGVGKDFNPLGDVSSDSDSSEDEDEGAIAQSAAKKAKTSLSPPPRSTSVSDGDETSAQASKASEAPAFTPRNYFNDKPAASTDSRPLNPLKDPSIVAALKKASRVKLHDDEGSEPEDDEDEETKEKRARLRRRAAMLASNKDRDLEDLDMGFGGSRGGDTEDLEDAGKVELFEWKGTGADDDDDGKERGGKKRKRGPKKKKGDKNSVADVMKAMERQKGAKS